MGILMMPANAGHGTVFVEMLIELAESAGLPKYRVEGAFGETPDDKKRIERILTKLGFSRLDEGTWEKMLK